MLDIGVSRAASGSLAMIVLGFDTATPVTAVAVLDTAAGRALGADRHVPGPDERPGHAERLLGMTSALLGGAGLSLGDVDRIAVGTGPGTFTGLRIGVATARGLGQAVGADVVGVSTLEALATAARGSGPSMPGVLAVLDARRGQAFAAGWRGGRRVLVPAAVTPPELAELAGPGWSAFGDGAVRFRDVLEARGAVVAPDDSERHLVDAAVVCRLGAERGTPDDPAGVLPDYIRPPDAVRKRP